MYKSVFEFDIAIDDALPVAVVERHNQLLEEPPGLILVQAALFPHVLKGITTIRVLHSNAEVVLREKYLRTQWSTVHASAQLSAQIRIDPHSVAAESQPQACPNM